MGKLSDIFGLYNPKTLNTYGSPRT